MLNCGPLPVHRNCLIVYRDFACVDPIIIFRSKGSFSLADKHLDRLLDVHARRASLVSYGPDYAFEDAAHVQILMS